MTIHPFIRQVEAMYERLASLYSHANALPSHQIDVLPAAFKELGIASEKLQMAVKQLLQQQEELTVTKTTLEAERRRYQDLFEFAPEAYITTDGQGVIQQVNRAAIALLKLQAHPYLGQSLTQFMPGVEVRDLRVRIQQLAQLPKLREWTLQLQTAAGEVFEAALSVAIVNSVAGEPESLRWQVRSLTGAVAASASAVLSNKDYDACQDRPRQSFVRGEIISFQPQMIWQVCQGLVKLSTFTERGEEVLVGLAGPSTPFGPALTALPLYQAIALSDVQVVGISVTELLTSPALAQVLLPKVNQRLKQTETLLAISGQRRVGDRLQALLQLLKQEIGEPVTNGVRLSVRLRHEDLANACCTTRVTVTRLLSELQQQGQISLDAKHHLILHS